jgi:hypothetical protein
MPYVTGLKITVIIHRLPSLLFFAIAEHQCGTFYQQLAIKALRQGVAFVINNFYILVTNKSVRRRRKLRVFGTNKTNGD